MTLYIRLIVIYGVLESWSIGKIFLSWIGTRPEVGPRNPQALCSSAILQDSIHPILRYAKLPAKPTGSDLD
jgi:hypothetical protein